MAAARRTLPYVLNSFRTTTVLRPFPRPHTQTLTPRTITSYQGLQGLAQPLQEVEEKYESHDHMKTNSEWQSQEVMQHLRKNTDNIIDEYDHWPLEIFTVPSM